MLTSEQIAWLQKTHEMAGGSSGQSGGTPPPAISQTNPALVNSDAAAASESGGVSETILAFDGGPTMSTTPVAGSLITAAPAAPIPLTRAPHKPAPPQPAPPQAAAPPAAAPEPAIDPSPIFTIVSAERLGGLLKTLDQVEAKVQDAMAADSAMRVGLKRRNVDVRDKDALAKRLDQVVPAIEPMAMGTLRTARQAVDLAGDGVRETMIEIETGKERLLNFMKLTGINRKDDAEADRKAKEDEAHEIAKHYDLVVQSEKAVMDILPALLNPFALASGALELLGTDMMKDKVEEHYKELLTKNKVLSTHLEKVIVALNKFGRTGTKIEIENIKKLVKLKDERITHLKKVSTNFVSILASLPAKGGGATPAALKEILDNYREVDEQRKKMAAVKKDIEKDNPALRDDEMLKSLQPPIGTFDPKLTKKLAMTRAGGSATFVYVQDPGHVTVFNLPSGIAQSDLEGIAARVNKLKLFDTAVHDAAALVESWKSTMDSEFSM